MGGWHNCYPPIVIGRLAHLAGIIPEPTPTLPQDLLPLFTWQKVQKEDITVKMIEIYNIGNTNMGG